MHTFTSDNGSVLVKLADVTAIEQRGTGTLIYLVGGALVVTESFATVAAIVNPAT